MRHLAMLFFTVIVAGLNPWISLQFNIPLAPIFVTTIFIIICVQEIWLIQIVYREDNIDFTRRFFERYPKSGATHFVRYLPHGLSASLLLSIWIIIGERPNFQGWYITCLLFFTITRIFDPLLGCISTFKAKPWSSIFAYLVVYVFVLASVVEPNKIGFIPNEFTLAVILASISVVIINLRMAYYHYFCFQSDRRLEGQLKFIFGSLIIISLPRLITVTLDMLEFING